MLIRVFTVMSPIRIPWEQRCAVLPSHSVPKIPSHIVGDVDSYESWEQSKADIGRGGTVLTRVSELRIPVLADMKKGVR